ncbi:MAG: DUF433 domain-containing protein [Armatimonadetes bacterium]|nr:DUF433 domain-containing protein [Armatimonadota bacterium]
MWTEVRAPIVLDEQGVAYIEGTTAKVIEIALGKQSWGLTPEELQEELPHLSLAQIYAALAYYHQHKEELDADIERRHQMVERMRAEAGPSPVAARLRAEGILAR